jgi:hypothetical protein
MYLQIFSAYNFQKQQGDDIQRKQKGQRRVRGKRRGYRVNIRHEVNTYREMLASGQGIMG